MILVLIKAFDMQVTYNSGWRSFNLTIATTSFLLDSVVNGTEAYDKFVKERLDCKSVKLFDKIPMMRKIKKMGKNRKPPNVNKETIHFLRMIDYSRLRSLDIADLLKHEIVSSSFYLTKDGELQKSPKSELARELKNLLKNLTEESTEESMPSRNS